MYQVPMTNIIAMAISFLICIGVPIALCVYMKKKENASLKSFFWGCAAFIAAVMGLEQVLHMVVLGATGTLLTDNIFLYGIYGGLAAGVFEESGRYVTMKFFMKKKLDKKEAIMYGVGHGGIEAILVGGMACISNLATSIMLNAGSLDSMMQSDEATYQSLIQLVELPAWQFLMAGMERFSAVILHICLSYVVYQAIKKNKIQLYILAILIHAVVNAVTVIAASYMPILLVEILLLAAVLFFAMKVKKSYLATVS